MRVSGHGLVVAAIACALGWGVSAGAQVSPCVQGIIGSGLVAFAEPIKNVAFSGTVKTSFEQKLADGNAIHSVTHTHQARDSAGRTRREMEEGCTRGADGEMHPRLAIMVNDPVARTALNWQEATDGMPQIVHVFHMPAPQPRREMTTAELERQKKVLAAAKTRQLPQQKETRTESLGTKDINGISAQGTRITRTIPAGEEGNDQPLAVVNETWRSKELGLTVMAISDDPRRGRTVTEYEELNRGEPDGALFSAPPGYTVQEQPVGILGGIGGGVVGSLMP
jgi:hypothetical protein